MLLVADVNESIKKHQAHIISSLKDPDIRYISLGPANEVFERTKQGMNQSWNGEKLLDSLAWELLEIGDFFQSQRPSQSSTWRRVFQT
jgi:hypothetical protein